jgi:hypothetical protein
MVWPALIGAGASLLGSAISSRGAQAGAAIDADTARQLNAEQLAHTNKWNRRQLRFAQKQFRYQRKTNKVAIRRQVKDAKAAGLHPLYALGHSQSTSPVSFIPGQTPQGNMAASGLGAASAAIGSGVSQAGSQISAAFDPVRIAQANALNASATRDEAQAALALSQATRTAQEANVTQDVPLVKDPVTGDLSPAAGRIQGKPSEIISSQKGDASTTAGKKPAFMEVIVGQDKRGRKKTMYVPYSDEGPAEGMEGMGALTLTILKNLGLLDTSSAGAQSRRSQTERRRSRYRSRTNRRPYAGRRR